MSRWIMYSEYPQEGGGSAFPMILSDREKRIVELMEEGMIISGGKRISFVEVLETMEEAASGTNS